ncbi:hypothetical protein ACP4OV_025771 [Aristida adscensionis]
MNSLALAGIIVGGIAIILGLKYLTRCIEANREWQAERARLQAMRLHQAAAGVPMIHPANGAHDVAVAEPPPAGHGGRVVIEMGAVNRFLDDILRERPARFTPANLREFTRDYAARLGPGGFGVVYRGAFPNGAQVAVKALNSTLDRRAEEQFMAEVGSAGRTHHINLVRLYGFCFDAATKALVYEYLEKGSLDRLLFEHDGGAVGFDTLFDRAASQSVHVHREPPREFQPQRRRKRGRLWRLVQRISRNRRSCSQSGQMKRVAAIVFPCVFWS